MGSDNGYTESHTLMAVVDAFGEGKTIADKLESCHVIVGGTTVPEEHGQHGLRIGVQEVSRYGMTPEDAGLVADCIVDGMKGVEGVKGRVVELARRFTQVRFTVA